MQAEHALVLGAAAFKEVDELSILLPELALLNLHLLYLREQLRFIYFFELTCLLLQLVYDQKVILLHELLLVASHDQENLSLDLDHRYRDRANIKFHRSREHLLVDLLHIFNL